MSATEDSFRKTLVDTDAPNKEAAVRTIIDESSPDLSVEVTNTTDNPVPVTSAATDASRAENDISHELLKMILVELKMIKTHLQFITEVNMKEIDLEEGDM